MIEDQNRGLISFIDELEKDGEAKHSIEYKINKYIDAKARKKGIPVRGYFELTPLCNLDCKMCYVHMTNQQLQQSGNRVLSFEEWKAIFDQAIEGGMLYALLTGGEALSHPDFDQIFLYLQERGINVNINTNGLLLTEKRIQFFKKHKPKAIQITLYGADDDTYESVTGHRVFEEVKNAIIRTRDAGIYVKLGITPNKNMVNNGESLIRLAKSLELPYSINSGLFSPREETGRTNDMDLSLDAYIQLYKTQASIESREVFSNSTEKIPVPGGTSDESPVGLRCGAGRSCFGVNWKGLMQPCLLFDEVQFDLSDTTFQKAWEGIRQVVDSYPIPQECNGCKYSSACPICVIAHAAGAPKGHANPRFCNRVVRFVQEGLISFNSET